jgi:hypothetical protein
MDVNKRILEQFQKHPQDRERFASNPSQYLKSEYNLDLPSASFPDQQSLRALLEQNASSMAFDPRVAVAVCAVARRVAILISSSLKTRRPQIAAHGNVGLS